VELLIVIAEVPDVPAVVRALYESRGLLRVADAAVRVAALDFEGDNKEKDKEARKRVTVSSNLLIFEIFI